MKIVIVTYGGLVQAVYASAEYMDVEVVDLDDNETPDTNGLHAVY